MSGAARRRERRAQRTQDGDRKIRLRDGPLHGETRHVLPSTEVFYSTFVDAKGRKHQIAYVPDDAGVWQYRGVIDAEDALR